MRCTERLFRSSLKGVLDCFLPHKPGVLAEVEGGVLSLLVNFKDSDSVAIRADDSFTGS